MSEISPLQRVQQFYEAARAERKGRTERATSVPIIGRMSMDTLSRQSYLLVAIPPDSGAPFAVRIGTPDDFFSDDSPTSAHMWKQTTSTVYMRQFSSNQVELRPDAPGFEHIVVLHRRVQALRPHLEGLLRAAGVGGLPCGLDVADELVSNVDSVDSPEKHTLQRSTRFVIRTGLEQYTAQVVTPVESGARALAHFQNPQTQPVAYRAGEVWPMHEEGMHLVGHESIPLPKDMLPKFDALFAELHSIYTPS